jgi:hypothetical protein
MFTFIGTKTLDRSAYQKNQSVFWYTGANEQNLFNHFSQQNRWITL